MSRLTQGIALGVAAVVASATLVACGGSSNPACATTKTGYIELTKYTPSKPNTNTRSIPKPPANQNKKYGTGSGSNAKSKPKTGTKTGAAKKKATSKSTSVPKPPSSQAKRTLPGEKAYTPPKNVKQPQADIDAVKQHMPKQLSRNPHDTYTSPVTHHVYIYHNASYFYGLGWQDPYDPYDPRNWNNPFSPFYGSHFAWVSQC